jgi:hypothetical protein
VRIGERRLALFCAVAGVVLLFVGLAITLANGGVRGTAAYPVIAGVALLIAYGLLDPAGVRDLFSSRGARFGIFKVLLSGVVVGILVVGNVLAAGVTQFIDLSRFKVNTLAPESVAIARHLDAPLEINFWDNGNDASYNQTQALIRRYQGVNANIRVSVADPDLDPATARRQGVVGQGTLVLQYKGRTQILTPGSTTEQDISSAILKLQSARSPVVCWVVGEGERDLKSTDQVKGYSVAADQLAKDNLTEQDLLLSQTPSVPADCDAVALIGPQKPLAADAQQALAAYLERGGRLLLALDSWGDPAVTAAYNELLKPFGRAFSGGLVVPDRAHAVRGEPTAVVVYDYGSSSITRGLNNRGSVFPETTSIGGEARAGVTVTPLAKTSGEAYLVQQPRQDYLARQAGDQPGPFTLAETVERQSGSAKSRLVLIGTTAFAENVVLNGTGGINIELLDGSLDWLAEQDRLLTLPPRGAAPRLTLTEREFALNLVIVLLVLPAGVALLGVAVWARRRLAG